jgi:hypothetical protein
VQRLSRFSLLVLLIIFSLLLVTGCSTEKVKNLKDDLVNLTMNEVAAQLENSLNQEFPGIQVNNKLLVNNKGEVNWGQFKETELANYIFFSMGDYDFRAVLQGDGVFKIQRINNSNNKTYSYAEFNVAMKDGKFQVKAK